MFIDQILSIMPLPDNGNHNITSSLINMDKNNLLCSFFNSSVIILSFSCNVLLLFSVVSLAERWLTCSSIADIKTCFRSENDDVATTCLPHQHWAHDFILVIMLCLSFLMSLLNRVPVFFLWNKAVDEKCTTRKNISVNIYFVSSVVHSCISLTSWKLLTGAMTIFVQLKSFGFCLTRILRVIIKWLINSGREVTDIDRQT